MTSDYGLVRLAAASTPDLIANEATIRTKKSDRLERVNVATWFLPEVTHALKGGVRTIFIFAERLSIKWGTVNIFVILSLNANKPDPQQLEESLRTHFPQLRFVLRSHEFNVDNVNDIPRADVAFCTLWTTAYLLLRYNQVKRKFYFMQDYEPLFYSAGSVYACIEQTYRFGFSCIANTPGVGNKYLQYSDDMVYFLPGLDKDIYHPRAKEPSNSTPYRIVFYGRPDNPRNCFSLGVVTLKAVKRKMGGRVDIYSAGAEWNEVKYGLDGVVTNLGLLKSLKEVADLYRTCDLGLVYMVTPHPSYQPFEYMACGCIVATNINEANRWLLNDENSIQLEPNPEIAAEKIVRCLSDQAKSDRLRKQGLATVQRFNWDDAYQVFEDRLLAMESALLK